MDGGKLTRPSVRSIPTRVPRGTSVEITGVNFGASQGTSTVTFNGTGATPTNWSDTSITVAVPMGATTGDVVVTVDGTASSGVSFTVAPAIGSLSPDAGPEGTTVEITGDELRGHAGDQHGCLQRDGGDADRLERHLDYGSGAHGSGDGRRGSDGGRDPEQRRVPSP